MGSNYERWGLVARVNGTSGGKQRDFALALDDLSAPVEDDEWTELDFGGRPVAQVGKIITLSGYSLFCVLILQLPRLSKRRERFWKRP